jgi:hypothetical protein
LSDVMYATNCQICWSLNVGQGGIAV